MMKMKKSNKKAKGMTLIEVIIALAIFSLLAVIMVDIGSTTKSLMRQTNHLNRKTAAEAPIGSVQDVEGLNEIAAGLTDDEGNAFVVASRDVTFTVQARGSSSSTVVNTKKYSTAAANEQADPNFEPNMRGNLEFYVIEEEEEAPAPGV